MSLGLVVALLAATPGASAPEQDIVVLGRKLSNWRATFHGPVGQTRCRMRRSSGDPEIDQLACGIGVSCLEEAKIAFPHERMKGLSRDARKQFKIDLNKRFSSCLSTRLNTAVKELAERRANAGSEG